jgi:hypothetical protein
VNLPAYKVGLPMKNEAWEVLLQETAKSCLIPWNGSVAIKFIIPPRRDPRRKLTAKSALSACPAL